MEVFLLVTEARVSVSERPMAGYRKTTAKKASETLTTSKGTWFSSLAFMLEFDMAISK